MRPPPETTFAEIDGAVADVDRVIRIFDALLRLAEIDAGLRRSGFRAARSGRSGGDRRRVLCAGGGTEEYRARLSCRGPADRVGRSDSARAGAQQSDRQRAQICARERRDRCRSAAPRGFAAEIAVTDNGPGISDSEKAKVMERFYRGDASRGTPGVGLGLSLAQAVAKLHGSTLEFSDGSPGLVVVLVLPCGRCACAPPLSRPLLSRPPPQADFGRCGSRGSCVTTRCAPPYIGTSCGSVGSMLTMRRSGLRSQKNAAERTKTRPNASRRRSTPAWRATNARFKSAPAASSRDSITVPCMLRTTYQRGSAQGSSGSCAARLLIMAQRYPHRAPQVHPVAREAHSCMRRRPATGRSGRHARRRSAGRPRARRAGAAINR